MPTHANMLELGITGRSDWYKDAALPPLPPLDHPAFAEKNRITSAGAHKAQDISEKKHHSRDETINTVLPQNIPYKLRVRKLSHLSLFSTGRREGLHVEKESRDYNRTRSTSFVQPSSRLNALTATPTRASQYLDPNYSIRRERKKHHARTGQQAQISTGIKSSSSNRRLSVEWNALQASKGIGADEDNWQAQVTREILMLSGITVPESGGNNLSRDSHVVSLSLTFPIPSCYGLRAFYTTCHSFPTTLLFFALLKAYSASRSRRRHPILPAALPKVRPGRNYC
jgi:hypothetical protein